MENKGFDINSVMRCYNNIKLHTRNLQNIENDGTIRVLQTLKDSQAM